MFLSFRLLIGSLSSAAFRKRSEGTPGAWHLSLAFTGTLFPAVTPSPCASRIRRDAKQLSAFCVLSAKPDDATGRLVGNTHTSQSSSRCESGRIGEELGRILPRPGDDQEFQCRRDAEAGDFFIRPAVPPSWRGPTMSSVVRLCQLPLRAARSSAQLEDSTAFAREQGEDPFSGAGSRGHSTRLASPRRIVWSSFCTAIIILFIPLNKSRRWRQDRIWIRAVYDLTDADGPAILSPSTINKQRVGPELPCHLNARRTGENGAY